MSRRKPKELSISTRSAKKQTQRTRLTRHMPTERTGALDQAEVVSRCSPSPLAEIYKSEAFRKEWANNVRFHVAENLLHLRRFRQLSQAKLGELVGTSQSAIARIESGQENITMDTLERLVMGLDGRFWVSIHPPEYAPPQVWPWWEAALASGPWNLVRVIAARRTDQTDQAVLAIEREHGIPASTLTFGRPGLLSEGYTSILTRP
jgi:transcriptional regulator with XRE-family HTH domain